MTQAPARLRGVVLTSFAVRARQFLYENPLRARIDRLDETVQFFRSVERKEYSHGNTQATRRRSLHSCTGKR